VCLHGLVLPCRAGYTCAQGPGLEIGTPGYHDVCADPGNSTHVCFALPAGEVPPTERVAPLGTLVSGGRSSCSECGEHQYYSAADDRCYDCTQCGRFQYEEQACSTTSNTVCAPCFFGCKHGCTAANITNFTATLSVFPDHALPNGTSDADIMALNNSVCLELGLHVDSSGDVRPCPPGHFCTLPVNTTTVPCPAGTYGASYGLSTRECDGECLHGFYCPEGSTSPMQVTCDAACDGCDGPSNGDCHACAPYYQDVAGVCEACPTCDHATFHEGCAHRTHTTALPCPAGKYCTESTVRGDCEAGYYCPAGSMVPRQEPCGDGSHYCPTGSGAPVPVPDGYVSAPRTAHPAIRTTTEACPATATCREGWIVERTCADHKLRDPGLGSDWAAVDPAGDGSVFVVWCDFDIKGGEGWAVIFAAAGGDDEAPFMADGPWTPPLSVTDPAATLGSESTQAWSPSLALKVALSSVATDTLFYRGDGAWIQADRPVLDGSALESESATAEFRANIFAPSADGGESVEMAAYIGYRRFDIRGGDDLYISTASRGEAFATPLTTPGWCSGMLLYSASSEELDSDAAYHAASSLGGWGTQPGGFSCATDEANGSPLLVAVRTQLKSSAYPSCREHLDKNPGASSGAYVLVDGDGKSVTVWCDMDTDGGGWTIMFASDGSDNEPGITSNVERTGNPFAFASFNIPRADKAAVARIAGETLFMQDTGTWFKLDTAIFSDEVSTPGQSDSFLATAVASDGSSSIVRVGWTTRNATGGGDFSIVLGDATPFDSHANATAPLLNLGCTNQLIYSNSSVVLDLDAAYDSAVGFGSWSATTPGHCSNSETGRLAFRVAMRDRAPLCPAGYMASHRGADAGCLRILVSEGAVPHDAAVAACLQDGAVLGVVASDAANAGLLRLAESTAEDDDISAGLWLGLTDEHIEGVPTWPSPGGGTVEFEQGQWSGATIGASSALDCTRFDSTTGVWTAVSCASAAIPVCSKPLRTWCALCGILGWCACADGGDSQDV